MAFLTVVTFKWRGPPGYRTKFEGHHVDVLRRMVRRHYPEPHRFLCVTDDPSGITEPDVEIFELWKDFSNIPNPSGPNNPSCYRRLRVFARNAGEWLGDRFVMIDLDAVIVGDLRPLWDRPEDFVIWQNPGPGRRAASHVYNGGMILCRAGARPELWEEFNHETSPHEARAAGYFGSDQAWIAHRLGPLEPTWGPADGVLSFKYHLKKFGGQLPPHAKVVMFHGKPDCWAPEVYKRHAWVREHYQ